MYFADTLQRLLFLRKVPIIGTLAPDLLAGLSQQSTERTFRAGEKLLTAASHDSMFVIVEGAATIEYRDRPVYHAGPHQLLGLFEALGSNPGTSVTADGPGLALHIPAAALRSLMDDAFGVVVHVLRETGAVFARRRRLLSRMPNALATPIASREPIALGDDLLGRLYAVRKLRPFQGLDMDTLVHFAGAMVPRSVQAGIRLWQEGDEAPYMLAVLEGELSAKSAQQELATPLGPGDVPGFLDAFASSPRWYSLTATSDARVATIPVETVFDILEDHGEASQSMLANYIEFGMQVFRDLAHHELLEALPEDAP